MNKHELLCEIIMLLTKLENEAFEKKASEDYINGINDSLEEIRKFRKRGKWM